MASISGSLQLPPNNFEWEVAAFKYSTYQFVAKTAVVNNVYSITGLTAGEAYLVIAQPKPPIKWSPSATKVVGDHIISTEVSTNPYVYKAISTLGVILPTARYWRIRNIVISGGTTLEVSEFQLWDNTANQNSLATITSNINPSSAPTDPLSYLFDGSLTTRCNWTSGISNIILTWDFGVTPKQITGIKIGGWDNSSRIPYSFIVEYSLDGVLWIVVDTVVNISYPGNNTLSPLYKIGYDPQYDKVSLSILGNGENNSQTFIDKSKNKHSIVVSGDTKISTTQSVFNGSSIYFDGSGDNLSIANHNSFILTNTFTIEFRFFASALTGQRLIFGQVGPASSYYAPIRIEIYNSTINIIGAATNGTWAFTSGMSTSVSANTWYHIALTSDGTTLRLFKDGLLATSRSAITPYVSSDNLIIGGTGYGWFQGYLTDIRLTVGLARYVLPFTVSPLPNMDDGNISKTGITEPPLPSTPGATILDYSITWQNMGRLIQPKAHSPVIAG